MNTEPQDLCEREAAHPANDASFRWNEVLSWSPITGTWTLFNSCPGPGFMPNQSRGLENREASTYSVHDPTSDPLLRFGRDGNGLRAVHYHISKKRYSRSGYLSDGTSDIRINQNSPAYDPMERAIYAIDAISARLYRYDVAATSIERISGTPVNKDAIGHPSGTPAGTRYLFVTHYRLDDTRPISSDPGPR